MATETAPESDSGSGSVTARCSALRKSWGLVKESAWTLALVLPKVWESPLALAKVWASAKVWELPKVWESVSVSRLRCRRRRWS